MKKIKLIYNSGAGQSKFRYFLDAIIEKFMENNCEVSVFRIDKNTNLYEYLKDSEKEGIYGIVVAGGDGTVNRVVNVMIKNKINVPIGVIPAGTSNDFARHIKMPNNFTECVEKILNGNIQEVDVGKVNDKYFVNICSAGLFTSTPRNTDAKLKNVMGKLSYFMTAVKDAIIFRPFTIRVETEKQSIIEKINVIMIFNGSGVGGFNFTEDKASIQDGLLDVVIIKKCKIHEASVIMGKILSGNYLDDKNVIYLKEKNLKIYRVKGKCDEPDTDGEAGLKFPLEVSCVKKAIKMFL